MIRLFSLVLLLVIAPSLVSAQPSYTLDKDPVRLGKKALEEGRLADATRAFQEAITAGYQVPKATFGLAEVASHEGRWHDAEGLYRRAMESAGKYPEAQAALGLLLLRRGDEAEAGANLQAALTEDPGLWTAQYGQARLLLVRHRPEEARTLLQRGARKKGLKDREDLYHHGMALYWIERGKLDEAEKEALIAFALNPAEPEISLLVGRVYQLQKTPYLAVQAFESALATPGSTPSASLLHQLGRLYEQVGRPNEARDTYVKAVAADSMYAPALKDLALLLHRGKQPEAAARAYLRYVTLEPKDVEALVGLSNACFDAHRLDEAQKAAEQALAVDSTRAEAKLAYVRTGLRSPDKSVKQKAAGLAASLPDSLLRTSEDRALLIGSDLESGRYEQAAARLEHALSLDPESATLHFQEGMLRMKRGHPKAAVLSFEKAVSLDPRQQLYVLNLGVALIQAKEERTAIAVLRKGVAGEPTWTATRMLLAQTLVSRDSLAAAETELRKVIELDPTNAKAFLSLGYSQMKREAYAEAVRSYGKATEFDPGNADAWAGLGSAHIGLEEWSKANEAIKRALSIDPNHAAATNGRKLLEKARGQ